MSPAPGRPGPDPSYATRRRASRLAAVQGLYALAVSGGQVERVLFDLCERRLGSDESTAGMAAPDPAFVRTLVEGVLANQPLLDAALDQALAQGWTLARLEILLQAILRAGAYELQSLPDVPTKVAITEYLEITHAFFAGKEPSLVNAVLDRLAARFRGPAGDAADVDAAGEGGADRG